MWQSLGSTRLERLVRAALLATLAGLPIGSILILSEARSHVAGSRNSFAVPALYLIEILVALAALGWAKLRPQVDHDPRPFMPLLGLVGLAAAAILWAPWRFLAGMGLVHAFVGFLFIYVLAHELRDQRFFRQAFWAFTAGAAVQAAWGLIQFGVQHDFGLWWLGESDIGPHTAGAAKLIANGETYVRAYGSLPHPNVLAAYLSLAAFWVGTVVFWKERARSWQKQLGLALLLALLGAGLLVTFSRVAIITTLIGGVLVALFSWRRWKWLPWPAAAGALFTLVVALALFPYWQGRTTVESKQETGVSNRVVGYRQAGKVIVDQPVGVGAGNFVLAANTLDPGRPAYQYQPVHNAALLMIVELGVLALPLFVLFLIQIGCSFHRNVSRNRQQRSIEFMLFAAGGAFILMSLADHFFWSLPQGLLLAGVLTAALIATAVTRPVPKA